MEGAMVRLPGFLRFQESTTGSVKAALLPLRSHTSFSFIIHGCKTQADPPQGIKKSVTTLPEKRMT